MNNYFTTENLNSVIRDLKFDVQFPLCGDNRVIDYSDAVLQVVKQMFEFYMKLEKPDSPVVWKVTTASVNPLFVNGSLKESKELVKQTTIDFLEWFIKSGWYEKNKEVLDKL